MPFKYEKFLCLILVYKQYLKLPNTNLIHTHDTESEEMIFLPVISGV